MTHEEINIAIAKACGIASEDEWGSLYHTDHGYVRDCPDFCKDLNAMHEAEKVLRGEQWVAYIQLLRYITLEQKGRCHATAHQRAETFLRTLNLWTE